MLSKYARQKIMTQSHKESLSMVYACIYGKPFNTTFYSGFLLKKILKVFKVFFFKFRELKFFSNILEKYAKLFSKSFLKVFKRFLKVF